MMRLVLAALAALLLLPAAARAQGISPNPQASVPTATGTIQGVAGFVWNGTAWVASTPVGAAVSGSTGTDYSANALAVPISGYVLVATIPATPTRAAWSIYNLSGAQIQYVMDDGSGTAGTVSSALLGGGSGVPSQGGSDGNATFKGRIRIYAPSSAAIVTAHQE